MEKVICIYHSADMDGKLSAGIVGMALDNYIDFVPANYGLVIDLDEIDKDTKVIIVDFSLELDKMKDIQNRAKELIWIDHHPVIDQYKEEGFNPPGLRAKEHSAAYYCWQYFFPDEEVPQFVKYVSDYDTWQHKYPESLAFNAALHNENIYKIERFQWSKLFNDTYIDFLLDSGKRLIDFINLRNQCVRPFMFKTELNGHPTIAINMRQTNSTVFDGCKDGVDVMMTFGKYGNLEEPRVTLYSVDNKVNVGKIAESFGGGGHAGAAGYTTPWDKLPLCGKMSVTLDYFNKPLIEVIEEDPYLNDYYIGEHNRIERSSSVSTSFEGIGIYSINHPLWTPIWSRIYELYPTPYVVWTFIGGQYLYRAYMSDERKLELKQKYGGVEMEDHGLWFLHDELLIQ